MKQEIALSLALSGVLALSFVDNARAQTTDEENPALPSLMDESREIALARSAAPPHISSAASLYVLRRGGYVKVKDGTNGFTCLVDRQYVTALEPICHNPEASETMLPLFLRRAALREAGVKRDEIERAINAEYASGALRLPTGLAFSYMFSSGQNIYTDDGRHLGKYLPHIMIWAPFLEPETIGGRRPPSDVSSDARADPYVFRSGKRDASLNVLVPEFIDPTFPPGP
jgi:hypothetical protein